MSRLSVSAEKYDELVETNSKLRERVGELEVEKLKLTEEKEELEKVKEALAKTLVTILDKKIMPDEAKLEDFLGRQKRIFQNKVNHGFNTTNIYQEARYILEEVAELMRAIEKNDRENMIEELADIIIFTYGCAEVARLGDLDTKVFEKMAINEKREYKQTEEGDFVKTGGQLNE